MNAISKISILCLFLLLASHNMFGSEQSERSNWSVELKFGSGAKISDDYDKQVFKNFSPSIRSMFNFGKRLSIGAESGFIHYYQFEKHNISTEFGKTDLHSDINFVPIILVFSMKFDNFDAYVGSGGNVIISEIKSFGKTSRTIDYDNIFMVALAYRLSLSSATSLAFEPCVYYLPQLNNFVANFNINFRTNIISW